MYAIRSYYDALNFALENGITHIDTSSNYMHGEAEILIGQVLESKKREDYVIVTKGGYIQGELLKKAQNGLEIDDLVKYDEECYHSISQSFIDEQIHNSLKRLNTDYIDVYLLHNPEYYLMKEVKIGMSEEQILHHHKEMQSYNFV